MASDQSLSTSGGTEAPAEAAIPTFWSATPEKLKNYQEHQHAAEADRLHDYWRQQWDFGEGEEPPFPFYVTSRDDEPTRATLRRLDELGIPYHVGYGNQYAPELSGTIYAPFWTDKVAVLPWDIESGASFGAGTAEEGHLTLDDFFNCFQRRVAEA